MAINYKDLDDKTRAYMAQELELDITQGKLYLSKRFNHDGEKLYPSLLKQTINYYDDEWLARELRARKCFEEYEERRKPNGGSSLARIPVTAPETFAEGEFNRYYCRGLCLRVVDEGSTEVVVYRGKYVVNPRLESQMMTGKRVSAKELLNDLRNSQGVDPALGLPSGPNSGLTISSS